ncbi:hypothetical protein ACET3Z_017875 [Daucus carota]
MEKQISSLVTPFALILLVFILLKVAKLFRNDKSKLPPGPRQLPFIGNIHQLIGSLPHHILKDLANKYGPLMSLKLGEVSVFVVSSPEIAHDMMKTHDLNFVQRPYSLSTDILSYHSSNIASSPYGDYWRQMRRICTLEIFSSKSVHKFRSIREEEVLNFINSVSQNKGLPINLSKELFSLTSGITARAAFGKRINDSQVFAMTLKEMLELSAGFSVADMYPSLKVLHVISGLRKRLKKVHKDMDKVLARVMTEHRDRNREADPQDLVDVLLKTQKDEFITPPLTDNNIKAVILDVISGGSETSSITIDWAMSEMLKNPKVMERAQAEIRKVCEGKENIDETMLHELSYLKQVIKETLRLHPAAPLLVARECREQCQLHGYDVPVKTKIVVNAWAIGRDPRFWADPDTFNPQRFEDSSVEFKGTNFEYIPFGAGRRICPGMLFALPMIELPLAQMLYRFDWKLPEGLKNEELDMSEAYGITAGRKHDLYVIPVAYTPQKA